MFAHTHFSYRSEHARKSLVARGGLARTFGSLACFLALTLLGLGVYILADAFANPMTEQATTLVFAAFILALASIMLFYLFKPRGKLLVARAKHREGRRSRTESLDEYAELLEPHNDHTQLELPYQPSEIQSRVRL
jgi:multisubunit Na+/H+ antiporter MnhG subunit